MTSVLSTLAVVALIVGAAWMFGSFVLRWGGALLALGSLATLASTGNAIQFWLLIPAAAMWLVGHWLYSKRHGYYKSRTVEAIADRVPGSRHTRVLRP